jgi:hypothetical protein
MLKINSETILDPQFPLLVVNDTKESLEVLVVDKNQIQKQIYTTSASIDAVLTKAGGILGVK